MREKWNQIIEMATVYQGVQTQVANDFYRSQPVNLYGDEGEEPNAILAYSAGGRGYTKALDLDDEYEVSEYLEAFEKDDDDFDYSGDMEHPEDVLESIQNNDGRFIVAHVVDTYVTNQGNIQ